MMKKIMLFAFVLVLAGAFAHAAGTTTSSSKPATTAAKTSTASKTMSKAPRIEGTVQSIDTAKHTVTVMVGTESKTFTLGSHTEYMQSGKRVKSAELKEGSKVSIDADSKNNARIVEIQQ